MIKEQFKNNGYVIINSDLKNNPKFLETCKNIYISLDKKLENTDIKKLRGYLMGNLNVYPGVFGDQLLNLIKETEIINLIEKIINKNLNDMEINYGGNLSLQGKGSQHFHTDGSFSKEMYLVSIATEKIDTENGPTEICVGSHKKNTPYWKFVFLKKNKKKIFLDKGDIIIRKHCLWHRGTNNYSKKNRLLLSFVIFPKSVNYQIKPKETSEISFSSNFFKENISGYIQEYIYTKLKLLHFSLRFIKSLISNR